MPGYLVYLVAAAAIALAAFVMGQFLPGWGVAFVILTSSLWVAYSAARQRRLAERVPPD